jgi:AcrR family transcriptional regulator
VGIAQPTIFRHFNSRDAIFGAVVGWVADNHAPCAGAAGT